MTVVLTPTAPMTLAQAPVGEGLEIRLEDISTTGYRWTLLAVDPPIVVLQDEGLAAGAAAGAAGVRRFDLLTVKAGHVVLQFELKRPWEIGSAPLKQISVDLQIR